MTAPPAPEKPRGLVARWRTPLTLLAGAVLLGLVLAHVSLPELGRVLGRARIPIVVAAVLLGVLPNAFRATRYQCVFPAPGRWLDLFEFFSILKVVNYVLPFRSGEVVALVTLKKKGLSPTVAETAPAWMVLRVLDFTALLALVALMIPALPELEIGAALVRWTLGFLVLSLAILVVVVFYAKRSAAEESSAGRGGWIASRLSAFRAGFAHIRSPGLLMVLFLIAVLTWSTNIAVSVLALIAFDAPLGVTACILACGIAAVLDLIPIRTPLGLGTVDAARAGSLVLVGAEPSTAVALAVGVRLVQFMLLIVSGGLGLGLSLRGSRTRAAGDDPAGEDSRIS